MEDYFFINKINFYLNGFFFIEGNKNKTRGNHAHKQTKQVLININSIAEIEIINQNKKIYNFFKPGEYLEIPKMTWVKINFKKKGFMAVLCDKKYLKSDYINSFEEFLSLKKK